MLICGELETLCSTVFAALTDALLPVFFISNMFNFVALCLSCRVFYAMLNAQ